MKVCERCGFVMQVWHAHQLTECVNCKNNGADDPEITLAHSLLIASAILALLVIVFGRG